MIGCCGEFLQTSPRADPMVSSESTSPPVDGSIQRSEANDSLMSGSSFNAPSLGMRRLLGFGLVAGLLAGAVSLGAGESIVGYYRPDLDPAIKRRPTADDMQRLRDARVHSATATFAAMGGLLGLAMGLAGGMAGRSAASLGKAAGAGLLVGACIVGLTAFAAVSLFYKMHDPQSGELILPMLTHGAIWAVAGGIGGLAFGLGVGGNGRRVTAALSGGLIGAAIAAVIYEIVGAVAFPTSKTDLPLSSSVATRGLAQILVAISSSLGAVVALGKASTNDRPAS
jgi:hypothetical protein